jgi:plastocyanin
MFPEYSWVEQPSDPSGSAWTVASRFESPGSFHYFCDEHAVAPGGAGMSGTVTVQTPATPPDATDTR